MHNTKYVLLNLCILIKSLISQEVIWECNTFPADEPFDSECNWERTDYLWGEYNVGTVSDGDGGYYPSLFYPNGSYAGAEEKGGTSFYANPFEAHTHIVLQYQLYFSDNFDFVLGGKIPGLYGGEGVCSGGSHNDNCFSTRFMWREEGALEIYAYIPQEQDDWFCDEEYVVCDYMWGHSFGRGVIYLKPGQWYTIEQDIRINDPGEANAEMKMLVDGEEKFNIAGLIMRRDDSISIDAIFFETFFGGSSTPDFASTDDVYTYYRDFKVYRY